MKARSKSEPLVPQIETRFHFKQIQLLRMPHLFSEGLDKEVTQGLFTPIGNKNVKNRIWQ